VVVSTVVDSPDRNRNHRGELDASQNALDNPDSGYPHFGLVVLLFMAVAPSLAAELP